MKIINIKIKRKPKLLISTWQSIYKKEKEFFEKFEGMIVDECHGADANSLQSIAKKCNAEYRFGFTGTIPTEICANLTITGYLGRKIFEKKADELIDEKILSQITIANLIIKYPKEIVDEYKKQIKEMIERNKLKDEGQTKENFYKEETEIITNSKIRNKIFNYIFNIIPNGQNTLILVSLIDHIKLLESYLRENLDKKYQIHIVYGDIKTDVRENIRKLTEINENVIIIASFGTFRQGINIKKLHNVIFASSLKSEVAIPQSIGRGLRQHESKEKLILWDIIDDLSYQKILSKGPRKGQEITCYNYIFRQFYERLKLYKMNNFKFFTKRIELNIL